jgi:hypothetical protein
VPNKEENRFRSTLESICSQKSVGSLRIPNLRILVRFLKIQTNSARSGLKADIKFYLLGAEFMKVLQFLRFFRNDQEFLCKIIKTDLKSKDGRSNVILSSERKNALEI